mmetsp:Transcript_20642/g.50676  ORF Transcript_20642/g.50676 Transcript_20642/m.50676 type:complete len:157 (-) Transcript_20642:1640-2110(-)
MNDHIGKQILCNAKHMAPRSITGPWTSSAHPMFGFCQLTKTLRLSFMFDSIQYVLPTERKVEGVYIKIRKVITFPLIRFAEGKFPSGPLRLSIHVASIATRMKLNTTYSRRKTSLRSLKHSGPTASKSNPDIFTQTTSSCSEGALAPAEIITRPKS